MIRPYRVIGREIDYRTGESPVVVTITRVIQATSDEEAETKATRVALDDGQRDVISETAVAV